MRIDHVIIAEADGGSAVVEFFLPTEGVEEVLELLRGDGDLDYVVVISAEPADTERFAELEDRYVEGHGAESVAPEEIRATALGMLPPRYHAMTVLSVLVAVAGLPLDSPAIAVDSMVIALQVGSALTASASAVLDDRSLVWQGLASQIPGLALAVAEAAVFGWLLRFAEFILSMLNVTTVNQISQRISPGLLSVTVGLSASAAGDAGDGPAVSLGVAALIPATAAVGIVWGLPAVALGALLQVVNTAAINLAGTAGYGRSATDPPPTAALAVAVLLLSGRRGPCSPNGSRSRTRQAPPSRTYATSTRRSNSSASEPSSWGSGRTPGLRRRVPAGRTSRRPSATDSPPRPAAREVEFRERQTFDPETTAERFDIASSSLSRSWRVPGH